MIRTPGALARVTLVAICAVAAPGWAAPVAEKPLLPEAQAKFEEAVRDYSARRYDTAIAAFREAYRIDPGRHILFAWAQAERLGGDCESAMALYRKFLALKPPQSESEAAQLNLNRCADVLRSRPHELVPEVKPAEPPPVAAPAPAVAPPPWQRDLLGAILAGSGGALFLGGVAALIASAVYDGRGQSAASYPDYTAAEDSAKTARVVGIVGATVGGALLVGAAVRYGLVYKSGRAEPSRRGVTLWSPGAVGLGLAGVF